jgi:hypothetical protein
MMLDQSANPDEVREGLAANAPTTERVVPRERVSGLLLRPVEPSENVSDEGPRDTFVS